MDESAGRPAKSTKIRASVHEFVVQHQELKASAILKRMVKWAESGKGEIGWNDNEEVFYHEAEKKPGWSNGTMMKEIRAALKRLRLSPENR